MLFRYAAAGLLIYPSGIIENVEFLKFREANLEKCGYLSNVNGLCLASFLLFLGKLMVYLLLYRISLNRSDEENNTFLYILHHRRSAGIIPAGLTGLADAEWPRYEQIPERKCTDAGHHAR
ncbi:hypothetical protein D3C86_1198790 [compost metagenome]